MTAPINNTTSDNWLNVHNHGVSGSETEITASTQAGSNRIIVIDPGDFQVGHGVLVSGNDSYTERLIWRASIQAKWQTDMPMRPLESLYHAVPDAETYGQIGQHYRQSRNLTESLDGAVELRGYDGSLGPVAVFYLEIDGAEPLTFRWSDDVARTWKAHQTPVTGEWQPLGAGVEIRFLGRPWSLGDAVLFDARNQLASRIEKIEGNIITLAHPATRTVGNAIVRHEDSVALQAAIETAIRGRQNVFMPPGRYRLLKGIAVINPVELRIEGSNAASTLMDLTEGVGSGFWLFHGNDVTIRNLSMVGHTGMQEGLPYHWRSVMGKNIWRTHCLRPARAVEIRGTRRVLVENVHVRRIACECFYCQCPGPIGGVVREKKPVRTEELTFLRCSVTDVGFNAFNNNDLEEGTSVLYCRMVDVGNCAWEGPARFIKFIGNYMRNCGCCAIGNISRRAEELASLGCGQSVFADNVFEGTNPNRIGIHVSVASTQVIIRNNLFVNFEATAIGVGSRRLGGHPFPVRNVTVTGNIIDLTCLSGHPIQRYGIEVGASDTIVSDNQIYVRGACDPKACGILVLEPAMNVAIHDNLVRNCREGITTGADTGQVGRVLDTRTFEPEGGKIPLEWPTSHGYRGWSLLWTGKGQREELSVIDHLDTKTCRFILREPRDMNPGDSFEMLPPASNWNIHNNTIEGCARPVTLGAHGSATSLFRNNIIRRGEATGVRRAVCVSGRHTLSGNHISGFDEPDSVGLRLAPDDKLRQACRCILDGNIFEHCRQAIGEEGEGLWKAAITKANLFIECDAAPTLCDATSPVGAGPKPFSIPPALTPVWQASRLAKPVRIDGHVEKWPWNDAAQAIELTPAIAGNTMPGWRVRACAGWQDDGLVMAVSVESATRAPLRNDIERGDWGKGDGLGIVLRTVDGHKRGPLFMFWGVFDGAFRFMPCPEVCGIEDRKRREAIAYMTQVTASGWTAEVRLPLPLLGLAPPAATRLQLNMGIRSSQLDGWWLWVPTGERIIYGFLPANPDRGGELRLV